MERFSDTAIKRFLILMVSIMLTISMSGCRDVSEWLPGISIDHDIRLNPDTRSFTFNDLYSTEAERARQEALEGQNSDPEVSGTVTVSEEENKNELAETKDNTVNAMTVKKSMSTFIEGMRKVQLPSSVSCIAVYYGYELDANGDYKPTVGYCETIGSERYLASEGAAYCVYNYLRDLPCNLNANSEAADNLVEGVNSIDERAKSYKYDLASAHPNEVKGNDEAKKIFAGQQKILADWMRWNEDSTWSSYKNHLSSMQTQVKNDWNGVAALSNLRLSYYTSGSKTSQVILNPTSAFTSTSIVETEPVQTGIYSTQFKFVMSAQNQFTNCDGDVLTKQGSHSTSLYRYYIDGYTRCAIIIATDGKESISEALGRDKLRTCQGLLGQVIFPDDTSKVSSSEIVPAGTKGVS